MLKPTRFFSRFKAELIEVGIFESIEEARTEIFSYIDGYYNRIRRHPALDYKSSLEFERELRIKNHRERQFFVLKNLTVSPCSVLKRRFCYQTCS